MHVETFRRNVFTGTSLPERLYRNVFTGTSLPERLYRNVFTGTSLQGFGFDSCTSFT
ncbi:MAG: hypothetical protein KME54_23995 [Tolypothrix brevis GSE-NOS-MK-07-07A]|nr:hypothetical protein [Tolypothrix brevis GSE-NOS-MK-07-07A]